MEAAGQLHTGVYEPLLGTRVSIGVRADDGEQARVGEAAALAECERLEALLSAYRATSAWSRWRVGDDTAATAEVVELLALAAHWHHASGGAFNPAAGLLRDLWRRAAEEGSAPTERTLAAAVAAIAVLPYRITDAGHRGEGPQVERTGDCAHLDLHAIAKGWIVDRAVAAAMAVDGVTEVLVNAGGDLAHRGGAPIVVGIEDPRRPYDNAPPLTRVPLGDGGLAASSGARRPLVVAGRRHSHVLDPRSGHPVQHTLAATVIAPDACTADAAATVVGVLTVAEALAWCASTDSTTSVACHLLAADGSEHVSTRWPR
jgi:thiamine biosynthesis lipoprotein